MRLWPEASDVDGEPPVTGQFEERTENEGAGSDALSDVRDALNQRFAGSSARPLSAVPRCHNSGLTQVRRAVAAASPPVVVGDQVEERLARIRNI